MGDNFEYDEHFTNKRILPENTLKREALKQALDIRKFEIELYWKRATYFWGFLIVIFAGYFAVLGSDTIGETSKLNMLLIISCIGFLFSAGWFLVNKGSKYWQNNWEKHVDNLEDEIMGPLYKSYLVQKKEKKKLAFITEPTNYSVSKINQILSFYLLMVWSILTVSNFCKIINTVDNNYFALIQPVLFFLLTISFLFIIVIKGKGRNYKKTFTRDELEHFQSR